MYRAMLNTIALIQQWLSFEVSYKYDDFGLDHSLPNFLLSTTNPVDNIGTCNA